MFRGDWVEEEVDPVEVAVELGELDVVPA